MSLVSCLGKKLTGVFFFLTGKMEALVITFVLSLIYYLEHFSRSVSITCTSLGFGRHRENQERWFLGPKDGPVQQYLQNHLPYAGLCAQDPDINKTWRPYSSRLPCLCVQCCGGAIYRSMYGAKEEVTDSITLFHANLYSSVQPVGSCTRVCSLYGYCANMPPNSTL